MAKGLRKLIFWTHLVVGIAAGIVIAMMCLTGVALAFEKEIIVWADREVRKISAPANATMLLLEELQAKAGMKGAAVTISTDPNVAVLFAQGRTNAVYVNQYTGAVSAPASPKMRAFMTLMIEWHRFIAQSGENRPTGKAITGACNVAFLFLALSGIYLWWPRKWNAAGLAAIAMFKRGLAGKARDWNWHNVIGIWSAPVLAVLTVTAMPISYKWAGDAIYKMTGTEAPQPAQAARPAEAPKEAGPSKAPPLAALLETVRKEIPNAEQFTVRPGAKLTLAVKEKGGRPHTGITQFTVDGKTGEVVKKEGYADYNAGRKVRSWTRFLHTGEALGPIGQAIAGVASFGGFVLVWTGFALAVRRFFGQKRQDSAIESAKPELAVEERA